MRASVCVCGGFSRQRMRCGWCKMEWPNLGYLLYTGHYNVWFFLAWVSCICVNLCVLVVFVCSHAQVRVCVHVHGRMCAPSTGNVCFDVITRERVPELTCARLLCCKRVLMIPRVWCVRNTRLRSAFSRVERTRTAQYVRIMCA